MNRHSIRLMTLASATVLSLGALLVPARPAAALAPLSFSWTCTPAAVCTFTVTSTAHASYQWSFGDEQQSERLTAKTASHTYKAPKGEFEVSVIGYGTATGETPDNIVGCKVKVDDKAKSGTKGTCK